MKRKRKITVMFWEGGLRTAAVVSPAQLAERLSSFVKRFRRAADALIASQRHRCVYIERRFMARSVSSKS